MDRNPSRASATTPRNKEQFSPRETNRARRSTSSNESGRSRSVGRSVGPELVCDDDRIPSRRRELKLLISAEPEESEEAWNYYCGTPNSAAKRSFVFQHRAR